MLDWLDGLVNQSIDLGRDVMVLTVIGVAVMVYAKTKAFVPVIGAIFMGGLAVFGISEGGLNFLETVFSEDATIPE